MATVQCLECGRTWEVARLEKPRLERIAERHTETTAHIEFRVPTQAREMRSWPER